ncbi:hypothetical protein H2248_010334 [Termitomyces sp. 'cryptogamus']|nr:hypothetical protein H2248_010334 [Termitomyces sp. 'cryptogamus']
MAQDIRDMFISHGKDTSSAPSFRIVPPLTRQGVRRALGSTIPIRRRGSHMQCRPLSLTFCTRQGNSPAMIPTSHIYASALSGDSRTDLLPARERFAGESLGDGTGRAEGTTDGLRSLVLPSHGPLLAGCLGPTRCSTRVDVRR